MHVASLRAVGFRNLSAEPLPLGGEVTLLWGPNGAGKSNALEALFLALTGRSPRTRRDREVIAFGEKLARLEVEGTSGGEAGRCLWSLSTAGERRHHLEGAWGHERPLLAFFHPDRLVLIKGPPQNRRMFLDRVCAAAWPARSETARAYGRALAQRNVLLARIRAGAAPEETLDSWDKKLAEAGAELYAARSATAEMLADPFAQAARDLGLSLAVSIAYRPRTGAADAEGILGELRERRSSDLARGYSTHGPHLDELEITLGERSLRRYGSQGEQRTAFLALLFAERSALAAAGRGAPLLLLDDVMSELDPSRRERLAERLVGDGQVVLTATEPGHLPSTCPRREIAMREGSPLRAAEALAAA